ncbi:MAG: phosphoenolpyruvate--protein phosphotransferase [Clostridia bacterium]|nr:phosphoenolpyruvate--protein phosphotransferase [Clostridia bacterium]
MTEKVLKGRGACHGIAIGTAYTVRETDSVSAAPPQRMSGDASAEAVRLEAAKERAAGELDALYQKTLSDAGEEAAEIFSIHGMLLEDEDICLALKDQLASGYTAEYAVFVALEDVAQSFFAMDDPYLSARGADVLDIRGRLLRCLGFGTQESAELPRDAIVIARDLSPSQTASLDTKRVKGIVTAAGSVSSHTAILARSMGIPAVIGVGDELLRCVRDGDTVVVDGRVGEVLPSPSQDELSEARKRLADYLESEEQLTLLKGLETVTPDGQKIELCANVGSVRDLDSVIASDAEGIGLFRSEQLYLERMSAPNEEEQLRVYRELLLRMGQKRVIIRTLDVGADKQVGYLGCEKEENPALGLRAIRLCLDRPVLFRTQLSALFRASVYGRLGIMFPMITSVCEVERILALCDEVKSDLAARDVPFSADVEIGIMIETPAAAVISDRLAPLVDFFSIGTNDLTQYTLAIDRQNPSLDGYLDTHHEAVLRLIELTVKNAHAHGTRVGICGELAADTGLTEFFLRAGVDELSVAPSEVLRVRGKVRNG